MEVAMAQMLESLEQELLSSLLRFLRSRIYMVLILIDNQSSVISLFQRVHYLMLAKDQLLRHANPRSQNGQEQEVCTPSGTSLSMSRCSGEEVNQKQEQSHCR